MYPHARQSFRHLVLTAALCLGLAQNAWACAFHGYTPSLTLIDALFASEHAVFARMDPHNPKHFVPFEALTGPLDTVELPPARDQSVQSRLRANPELSVLFARTEAYGPWVPLGLSDHRFRDILRAAIGKRDRWLAGREKDRLQFFANLAADPNEDIRTLALLELDRASYRDLRELRLPALPKLIGEGTATSAKLRPIRILLTGLSGNKGAIAPLERAMQTAAQRNRPYLGAYATALIELGQAEAVERLLHGSLRDQDLSRDAKEKLIEALAIHGKYGTGPTKRAIRRGLPAVLQGDPSLAAPIARQFGSHGNTTMAKAVKKTVAAVPAKGLRDALSVRDYLAQARKW